MELALALVAAAGAGWRMVTMNLVLNSSNERFPCKTEN